MAPFAFLLDVDGGNELRGPCAMEKTKTTTQPIKQKQSIDLDHFVVYYTRILN